MTKAPRKKAARRPKPPTTLALARLKAGLTQERIASELGIKQPTYSAIESGKVVPDALQAQHIARLLSSSVAELWPVRARRAA